MASAEESGIEWAGLMIKMSDLMYNRDTQRRFLQAIIDVLFEHLQDLPPASRRDR